MSRKIIRDFIKQADKLDNDQAARYFDTIMEVYEDCVHTANERVAILESDTLWLLVEYRRIVEAKDNTPEEKQQHRMAQGNLWQLLSVLIDSTADKGIYLSEAFIKKYENVDFVGIPFGKYVRECYNVRKWHTPEPQQKHTEAPQQPIGGNSGELAGNGKENAPEGSKQPDIKKEELPTIYDDAINKAREQQVFYNAIKGGWMQLNGTTYKWLKNKEYLALMCGLLYWGDEVKDDLGAKTDDWGEYPKTLSKSKHRFKYEYGGGIKTSKDIKDLFGGIDVSNLRSQITELPDEYGSITRLFPTD